MKRMLLGAVERQSLPQQVAEHVGRAIVSGRFVPGAALPPEVELTRELGVSRTVLREALVLLTGKGLIRSRTKSGTVVLPVSAWNTLDVDILGWKLATNPSEELVGHWFDFRQQFEPYAARLATKRGTDGAIAKIAEAGRRLARQHDHVSESIEADIRLHQVILEASGNPFLVPLGRTLESALRASFQLSTYRLGAREGAVPLHQDVVDAIVRRDGPSAESAMLRLIEVSRDDLLWVLARRRGQKSGVAVLGASPASGKKARRPIQIGRGTHAER